MANKEYNLRSYYVDVYEDSWEEGEGDNVHSWEDYPDKSFSSKSELMKRIKEIIEESTGSDEVKEKDIEVEEEELGITKLYYSELCKYVELGRGYDHYEKPNKKELEQWKKGEIKLFNVHFIFAVEIYEKTKLSF